MIYIQNTTIFLLFFKYHVKQSQPGRSIFRFEGLETYAGRTVMEQDNSKTLFA